MRVSGLFWAWLGVIMLLQPARVTSLQVSSGERLDPREAECISHYASKLDDIRGGLGDAVRIRAEEFDFTRAANRNDTKMHFFGAGYGTTGTRSLHTALQLMGFTGEHADLKGLYRKMIYKVLGIRGRPNANCKQQLKDMFPSSFKYDKDYILDTPVAELFLDLYWTFPDAKFILTTRSAEQWVKSRIGHHDSGEAAVLEEPCNLHMASFTDQELTNMYLYHNDLVRCVVPKERLFEINVFEDPPEKLRELGKTLALFLGAKPIDRFPGTWKAFAGKGKHHLVQLKAAGDEGHRCASESVVADSVPQNTSTFRSAEGSFIPEQSWLIVNGSKTQIRTENLGMLMHHAEKVDCELDLVQDEQMEDAP